MIYDQWIVEHVLCRPHWPPTYECFEFSILFGYAVYFTIRSKFTPRSPHLNLKCETFCTHLEVHIIIMNWIPSFITINNNKHDETARPLQYLCVQLYHNPNCLPINGDIELQAHRRGTDPFFDLNTLHHNSMINSHFFHASATLHSVTWFTMMRFCLLSNRKEKKTNTKSCWWHSHRNVNFIYSECELENWKTKNLWLVEHRPLAIGHFILTKYIAFGLMWISTCRKKKKWWPDQSVTRMHYIVALVTPFIMRPTNWIP